MVLAIHEELWQFIPDYDKTYAISTHGRVLTIETQLYRKPSVNNKGVHSIILSKNGTPSSYTIHRLVAETFMEDFDPRYQVRHIDGDKGNCGLHNLEQTERRVRGCA